MFSIKTRTGSKNLTQILVRRGNYFLTRMKDKGLDFSLYLDDKFWNFYKIWLPNKKIPPKGEQEDFIREYWWTDVFLVKFVNIKSSQWDISKTAANSDEREFSVTPRHSEWRDIAPTICSLSNTPEETTGKTSFR